MSRAVAATLVLAVLCSLPAWTEEQVVTLDPEATEISFTLGAFLHKVEGSFRLEEGEIRFDLGTGEASGRVVVDATSGDTDNAKRDRQMHAEVLESGEHPTFVFEPRSVEGALTAEGCGELTLHGSLEVRGETHDLSVTARVAPQGERLEASFSFTVPYVAWGMKDPSKLFLRVEKQVEVTVKAVGRLGV